MTRSLVGHLEHLRLALEAARQYVGTNRKGFVRTASPGTMARAERAITKIQVQMGQLDRELSALEYDIIGI